MKDAKKLTIRSDFTEDQLVEYFNEHVLYELLVLRYSYARLKGAKTQILWNVVFSAFNVSARNLYEFLNNKGSSNEVKCSEYLKHAKTFRLSSVGQVTGTLQMLNEQVFHMGRKRLGDRGHKVNMERVHQISEWIEENVVQLVGSFEETFATKIQMQRADPNHRDGFLRVSQEEVDNPQTSSQGFELRGGQGLLPAQNHSSHIDGVFVSIEKK
jgi:hypothetical protein